jgi:hypothetical protein
MWVRSEDGKTIVDARAIYVDVLDDGQVTMVCTAGDNNDIFILAQYSSEEEAVKELDALEKWSNDRLKSRVYRVNRPSFR